MGFAGVNGGEVRASENVFTLCDGLKMVGVDAERVVANVVDYEAIGDGSVCKLESDAMNVSLILSYPHDWIPVPIMAAKPNNATSKRNRDGVIGDSLTDGLSLSGTVFHTSNV